MKRFSIPGLPSHRLSLRWVGLGILLLLSLCVIFVLPPVVERLPVRPLQPSIDDLQDLASADRSAGARQSVAPFAEAQQAQQRKEAQDILAQLLQAQADLAPLEVASWGGDDYEAALQAAAAGDEHYRARRYPQAEADYQGAYQLMAGLLDSVPEVLARLLAEGEAALDEGDSATATARFDLAAVLSAESPVMLRAAATAGQSRAGVLDDVQSLLDKAHDQRLDEDLEGARQSRLEARSMDSTDRRVLQRLAAVERQLIDAEFSETMSGGFTLLAEGQAEAAMDAFIAAATLDINAEQARQAASALTQAETALETQLIDRLQEGIRDAEGKERWQAAADLYGQILNIDSSLRFASEGRAAAASRARLHQQLEELIAKPVRLSDAAVNQSARQALQQGRAIQSPGPRLRGQLEKLQGLLWEWRQLVEVPLVSDGLTTVVLRRIGVPEGTPATFLQTSVDLQPGDYIAVGRREGYVEARVEFQVRFGQTPQPVIVQCTEKI